MSFSLEVKNELCSSVDSSRHCRFAELAAFTLMMSRVEIAEGERKIEYFSENEAVLSTVALILKKLYGSNHDILSEKGAMGNTRYFFWVAGEEACEILKAVKYSEKIEEIPESMFQGLVMKSCCKRAFLRGAFLCAGTMSDPDKSYHLEINCKSEELAMRIIELMNGVMVQAKFIRRAKYFSVYLKDSNQIIDFLGILGARVSLLEMENARILHSMRENINRKVNCETANINKAANASAKQISDIKYIEECVGLSDLPNGLDEVAKIRLKYPTATLKELGEHMDPPLSKSCINHRLRKLSSMAERIREEKGRR